MIEVKYLILAFGGLASGFITSAALFALIATIGVLSRLAQMTRTASRIRWYEVCFMMGSVLGNTFYIYQLPVKNISILALALLGTFMGIYLGCFIGALAEVINVFPILFHRLRLRMGLKLFILSMALGKAVGGIIDFFV